MPLSVACEILLIINQYRINSFGLWFQQNKKPKKRLRILRIATYILPFLTNLLMQAEMPFLVMVRIADVLTFKVINSPNSGTKNFLVFKLGLNLRLVLMLECETRFPTIARLPVKSQIFDIVIGIV